MFDIQLRPLKDSIFDSVCDVVPRNVTPLQITFIAFLAGCGCCMASALGRSNIAITLWTVNRALDCLDGAVARKRKQTTETGGFLDLLADFVIYAAIPICCSISMPPSDITSVRRLWLAAACAEAAFFINNFVLFYIAAVTEKMKFLEDSEKKKKSKTGVVHELTSVSMRPALIEGFESGLLFTVMIAIPWWTEILCWILFGSVAFGTLQRVCWVVPVLAKAL